MRADRPCSPAEFGGGGGSKACCRGHRNPAASPARLRLHVLQLSVLRLFETILSDPVIKRSPDHQELLAFAKRTVRNMFERCARRCMDGL